MQTTVPQPYEHVLRHASERPDTLAVVGSAVTISYAQLADHASRIAGVLRSAGVRKGDVVGVLLPMQLEVILVQALFQLAAISCHPPTGGSAIALDWLVSLEPDSSTNTIVVDGPWLAAAAVAPRDEPTQYDGEDDICRLIFSSGTTGSPKAVPMSVRNLAYRASIAPTHWMAQTPILCILDLTTASGSTAFFASMVGGGTYILPGIAQENLALLSRFNVASIKGSPAQLAELASAIERTPVALPALASILSVGSHLPEDLARRLATAFDAAVINLYGSSESGVLSLRNDGSLDPMDAGTIVHDMTVEIVDDADTAVAPGAIGFIRSRRPHQATGYYRDPAASAAHFRDGWFYPGDLGSLEGTRLHLAGRSAELINAGGVKVDPARIDAAAAGFPGLVDAAAFSLIDAAGIERVGLAFVGEIDVEALVTALRATLGSAAPSRIIRLTTIPRTAMGKARRGELSVLVKSRTDL